MAPKVAVYLSHCVFDSICPHVVKKKEEAWISTDIIPLLRPKGSDVRGSGVICGSPNLTKAHVWGSLRFIDVGIGANADRQDHFGGHQSWQELFFGGLDVHFQQISKSWVYGIVI